MTSRWYSANVLQTNAGGRRLWHLMANNDRFTVQDEITLLMNEPCPPMVVGKDWQTLFRKKLNIAWMPADKVFFRSVQLPSSDPAEIASMVELQLEKLSPLPVTHIVWSIYLLPCPADKPEALQNVLVIIAARSTVEEFLGQLSTEGFLPDRLEASGLEQFLAAKINEEGVWIFAGAAGEPALVVWWYGGTVQNLTLVTLPAGPERGPVLKTQLEQVAWTGELDGWLTGPLKVHLLAAHSDSEFWSAVFKEWGEQIQVVPPASPKELAALSAQRCASAADSTSLLPAEFAARYRQQFVDRLWMRGLVSVVTLYVLGVLFYFGMLYVFEMQDTRAKSLLASMRPGVTSYSNDVVQIKILKDRAVSKYAALDCWKAVAENLPDSMTVDTMYFQRGKLELRGSYLADDVEQVGTFNEALRTATDPNRHEPLFSDVSAPTTVHNSASGGNSANGAWSFNCSIKGAEQQ
jgi:hypothetical protein